MGNLESDEAVSAGLAQKRGGIQPKVYFASVLLPGIEFKEQRVNARQGEPPVCRRCTRCSSNGRGECGVSCFCSINSFQVCSRFQQVTRFLLQVSDTMFAIHCIPTLRQLFHVAILFPARILVRASLQCILFLSYLMDM